MREASRDRSARAPRRRYAAARYADIRALKSCVDGGLAINGDHNCRVANNTDGNHDGSLGQVAGPTPWPRGWNTVRGIEPAEHRGGRAHHRAPPGHLREKQQLTGLVTEWTSGVLSDRGALASQPLPLYSDNVHYVILGDGYFVVPLPPVSALCVWVMWPPPSTTHSFAWDVGDEDEQNVPLFLSGR